MNLEVLLPHVWYVVVAVSLIMYVMLDGFDLGVGMMHLTARNDHERRLQLNSIGPVWDGNEVWLVIIVGTLFAGFPHVYATLLSGFYGPVMFSLMMLIFRAVSIEFRSKRPSPRWRSTWDFTFFASSLLLTLAVGTILGHLAIGLPLDSGYDIVAADVNFFDPYAVLVGVTGATLLAMHGAIYLVMKTEGELQQRLIRKSKIAMIIFFVFYAITTAATITTLPHMTAHMHNHPSLYAIPVLGLLTLLNVSRQMGKGNSGWAFLSSCGGIFLLIVTFGAGTFPNLVRSTSEYPSLTIMNSVSSQLTLKILLIICSIGLPLVFGYGTYVYRIFRGKVVLEDTSY